MIINMERVQRVCRIKHPIIRESLAELIGTTTLVFFGNAAIANSLGNPVAAAINVPLGYATALALAVYVSGGVSGGHVNPAVTLGMCLTGRCDLNRLLPFALAQFIGGFLGAALTHGLFFDVYQEDKLHVLPDFYKVFATYPNDLISMGGAFLDQVMGTALLLFGIMAVTDRRNMQVPKGAVPPAIGLVLFGVITASSSNTGAALNPARDFSPRLYSYIIGYDMVFKVDDHFFWIPLVACLLGGAIGSYLYFFGIEVHHPPEHEKEDESAAVELETGPSPARPSRPSSAPKHGQQNDGYRSDDGYPRGGGYPRDASHPRGPSYPREGGYPRAGGHPRNEGHRGEGYM